MIIAATVKEVRDITKQWRQKGLSIGLVPTMGYLHEGHASLIRESVRLCDRTVASVFVNPTQFGPGEDLEAYPRDFMHDAQILEAEGCDLVFHPDVSEMYPEGFATYVEICSDMPKQLCGKTRPTHFKGVCTVVNKLFNIVTPDKAFFGQKDAQQLAIIKRMVKDLSMGIEIIGCPIIRQEDGLALSSRNAYLNEDERRAALVLSKAVFCGQEMAKTEKDAAKIVSAMRSIIEAEPLARIDYVSGVDAQTLMPVERTEGPVLFAMAVYIGKTRLIDNFSVGDEADAC